MTERHRGEAAPSPDICRRERLSKQLSVEKLVQQARDMGIQISASTIHRIEKGVPTDRITRHNYGKALNLDPKLVLSNDEREITLAFNNFACYQDLIKWRKDCPTSSKVKIDSIALDLTPAAERILGLASELESSISVRLVMLPGDWRRLKGKVPTTIKRWTKAVQTNLSRLHDDFDVYNGRNQISLQIKEYRELPTMHGSMVKLALRRWYISECKYDCVGPLDVDWGEGNYRVIMEGTRNAAMQRLANDFDVKFDRLWRATKKLVFSRTLNGCTAS